LSAAVGETWAIVLAAGQGTRLQALTTDRRGRSIPKQFCSLGGGPSLLGLALARAARLARPRRTSVVVAAEHSRFWRGEVGTLPRRNVISQPCSRGTAIGVLLPLLDVLHRDPSARIVILPSDHFVADEPALADAALCALREVARRPERVVLLGIVPDGPEAEFGWVLPLGAHGAGPVPVRRFVEKPPPEVAVALLSEGGVWNSFILAAQGSTLLELFERRLPRAMSTLRGALAPVGVRAGRIAQAYDTLDPADFSRDVLEGQERRLSVLPVPACGWNDLGTPERVARCVARLGRWPERADAARLDLALACS